MTAQDLIQAIISATVTMKVCVPSDDYYRRLEDWSEEDIVYVDAKKLLGELTKIGE